MPAQIKFNKSEDVISQYKYMPQLDSLRALAAFGVFAQHFLSEGSFFRSTIPLGDLGVRLFFVLSGYLISLVILNSRQNIEQGTISVSKVVWHFYMRRFLRLVPVYFMFLALSMIFLPEMQQYAPWFFSYMQNIHYAIEGEFTFVGHIWTLAVEEQFYLIWPFLMLFVPYSKLIPIITAVVLSGPIFRILFLSVGFTHFQSSMLTPSHFDTLGLGALLAIYGYKKVQNHDLEQKYLSVACWVGLSLLVIVFLSKVSGMSSNIEFLLGETGAGLFSVWVIGNASKGFHGPIEFVLKQPILIYLGKISYGMYVYHMFVPDIFRYFFSPDELIWNGSDGFRWLVFSLVSIFFAMVSWHLMEQPILSLKKYFAYQHGTA